MSLEVGLRGADREGFFARQGAEKGKLLILSFLSPKYIRNISKISLDKYVKKRYNLNENSFERRSNS